jgi:hypothetical protein
MSDTVFCEQCGASIRASASFCASCGNAQTQVEIPHEATAMQQPCSDPAGPLLCDSCGRLASSVHMLPDADEPAEVVLACDRHDPGGEWWLLTEETDLDRLWDNDTVLDRLRPDVTARLPFTALAPPSEPEVHEDGTKTCPECAERVKGDALVCRFCGHRFDGSAQAAVEANTSGAAVAAFICSLVGLWIAGIPLGIHAQRQIDRSGGRKTGRGFATAGIVIGVVQIIGIVILVVVIMHAAVPRSE